MAAQIALKNHHSKHTFTQASRAGGVYLGNIPFTLTDSTVQSNTCANGNCGAGGVMFEQNLEPPEWLRSKRLVPIVLKNSGFEGNTVSRARVCRWTRAQL
jgi:hypothetical protein